MKTFSAKNFAYKIKPKKQNRKDASTIDEWYTERMKVSELPGRNWEGECEIRIEEMEIQKEEKGEGEKGREGAWSGRAWERVGICWGKKGREESEGWLVSEGSVSRGVHKSEAEEWIMNEQY